MKDISKIADLMAMNNKIVKARKNYTKGVVLTLLGVSAVTCGSFIDRTHDSWMLALLTLGVVLTVIGIVMILRPANNLVFSDTGERIHKFDIYYDSDYDAKVLHEIRDCSFEKLKSHPSKANGGKKLATVFTIPSGKMKIAQIFNFVPYEYTPYTDPIEFTEAEVIA